MTLELADRSITRPKGVAEDVFVKVGKFHFPTNFVVIDFDADPRVPLILGRSFLRTDRALIDVYGEEITLRVNDEAVTFNLNQTTRYSSTYDDMSVNRIDVIDVACEEYAQEIDFLLEEFAGELDLIDPILPGIDEDDFDEEKGAIGIDIFQIEDKILREKLLNVNLLIDKIEALNLTPSIPFVLKYPSSSPNPVVDSDFLIEEVDTFLVSEYSIPPGIESDFDSERDIIFLNDLLNDDPIPVYERFTFDIEPDAPVINNFDEFNEDKCFNPGGGEIVFSPNVEDDDSFTFFIRTFLSFLTYPKDSPLLLSTRSEDTIFDPGIST
ncbi:reverse transcriptase domain-containing protein [Tanacetum coccineum]